MEHRLVYAICRIPLNLQAHTSTAEERTIVQAKTGSAIFTTFPFVFAPATSGKQRFFFTDNYPSKDSEKGGKHATEQSVFFKS